ncbi:mechanosensitive ion channel [Halodesulfurarchaeum formicicum]|uniref:Mechanosensitive ion channel n=1 Tax=Halodesulfurarchaeum formicicum TaxID=1873524 RepID=A0A1D8S4M8_9EURY|nr:mechanosensitive ion channel family protein [Halodesulfurarchaeum formicicum]AOW80300.1 mechanosensitive ion channel [Halodesulfurarchaeum formicicum]APE95603.1 mechanosensitive ion channel [Halodesulfurarchaeum formicicum]
MIPIQLRFAVEPYVPLLLTALTRVFLFLVVFGLLYWLGKPIVTRAVRSALEQRGFEETLISLAVSVASGVTVVFAIAIAATVAGFGVVLAAFATLAGALALAVGFAARDLIANFVAGIFILQDKPFVVGDWIEWNGNSAVVRDIELRVTKLDTFDNELVTVPNSELASNAVFNNVANDRRRIAVGFGIGYGDDIQEARAAILEEAAQIDGVLEEPEPSAPVVELGDSAVVLSGRIWIDPQEDGYGGVRAQFVEAVKERFDEAGIDMPYPTNELTGEIDVNDLGAPAPSD